MNFTESKFARSIEASMTLAVTNLVAEQRAKGKSIISLGAGEPDFDTPDEIKQKAIEAIQRGETKYTPNTGSLALREAICRSLQKDFNSSYEPSQIVVSNGAKQCIHNAILAVCSPGDEVIIPAPYWVSYPEQVKMAAAVPRIVDGPEKNNFKITPDILAEAITPRTKMLILNNPSNPTGSVYSTQELQALAEVLSGKPIYVLADEIYIKLTYDMPTTSLGEIPALSDQLLLVNGFSKAYAMTGWRLGYIAGPQPVIKAIAKIQSHTTSNASSISQAAGIAALKMGDEPLHAMKREFKRRRDYVFEALNQMPGISAKLPGGAFYILPNVGELLGHSYQGRKISTPTELAMALVEHAGIAVVAGEGFGARENVRISYATSMENLKEAMQRLRTATEEMMG